MLKKINTVKFINIFSYIFCIIYFLFVFLFAGYNVYTTMENEKELQNLLAYVNKINKYVENSNFHKNENNQDEINTKPLYTDGKTALITSYNNLLNSNSFFAKLTGNMYTTTLGIDINVLVSTTCIKYNNSKIYENRANHLYETNASSMFMSMINNMSNKSIKILKNENETHVLKSTDTYIENEKVFTNFDTPSYIDNNEKTFLENLYIINEDTISAITYFKINYKNGKPLNYYVQAELDINLACINYAKVLGENSNAVETPIFSKIIITAIIDSNGNISGLTTTDICTLKMSTPLGIKDCPCKFTQKYAITQINENITFIDEDF